MPVRFGVKFGSMESKGVRRCLFGIPDHDELKKELKAQLEQTSSEMKTTWNFDPLLDQPLNGRFEWNLPEKDEYVPSFYTKQYRPTRFRSRRNVMPEIDLKSEGSDLTPPASPVLSAPVIARLSPESESDLAAEAIELKRENETTPEARVIRQTKIPDFMKVKKRRLSEDYNSEDSENSEPKPKNARSLPRQVLAVLVHLVHRQQSVTQHSWIENFMLQKACVIFRENQELQQTLISARVCWGAMATATIECDRLGT